jgi:hypothetical protein
MTDLMNDMLDEMTRGWVMLYYWPFFLAGNIDNFKELGSNLCKPYSSK